MPSYDFSSTRFLMRVRFSSIVTSGMMIIDVVGRHFITAELDEAFLQNEPLYRNLRLFPANTLVRWERESSSVDPLTQLERGTGKSLVKEVRMMVEPITKEPIDLTLRIQEQKFRVITNEDVKEGDILNDMVVRRVDQALGVKLLELQ